VFQLTNFLKDYDDDETKTEASAAQLIPTDEGKPGKYLGRRMMHDAMSPELQVKIDEIKAREDKKE
jgi:hypothetical protein